jgi:acetylornithine deacetylase/succinyl-diaminopimelate desuccinylase-like protein
VAPTHEELRAQLAELIAIPSVSADPAHAGDVEEAAEWVATRIRGAGGSADVVPWNGGRPLVIGELKASERPEQAPTILCYAHFDVQPRPARAWDSPPFELAERDGGCTRAASRTTRHTCSCSSRPRGSSPPRATSR